MELTMLKGKIHRVRVTQAALDYVGSITIDEDLLDAAGILEYEKVAIVDVNNGQRLETYTIAGERGSGTICLNGAAARCVCVGDLVIIMCYASMSPDEAGKHRPNVVLVDENNHITNIARYEKHGMLTEDLKEAGRLDAVKKVAAMPAAAAKKITEKPAKTAKKMAEKPAQTAKKMVEKPTQTARKLTEVPAEQARKIAIRVSERRQFGRRRIPGRESISRRRVRRGRIRRSEHYGEYPSDIKTPTDEI